MSVNLWDTRSKYDPLFWYLKYNNDPTSKYYNWYVFNPLFDSAELSIP